MTFIWIALWLALTFNYFHHTSAQNCPDAVQSSGQAVDRML